MLNIVLMQGLYHIKNAPFDQVIDKVGLNELKKRKINTLSKGYQQRVGLAAALLHDPEILILDEPTTGLHFEDIRQLLEVLHRLRDGGNTVVIIEHNLDVIKTADWVIDLGPEGGSGGGQIIATGTPEDVAAEKASHTGRFLAELLKIKRTGTSSKDRSKAA